MKKIVRMLQMAVSEVAVCGGDQALVKGIFTVSIFRSLE